MLLDRPNVELLKLIALCKDFPCRFRFPDIYLLSDTNIVRLIKEGLLCVSKNGRYYRVTRLGYYLLNQAGIDCEQDTFRETNDQTLTRREQSAMVMLTLMLAGVDVFATDTSQLTDGYSYLSANIIRRIQRKSSMNLTGNARFTGLTGGSGLVFFYMSSPQELLLYKNEMKTASRMFSSAGGNAGFSPVVVYAGTDYSSLCAAVTGSAGNGFPEDSSRYKGTGTAGKRATYRTAYDKFDIPVYLCPCNPDGAIQMRVMLQPDYRARLTTSLFQNEAAPPNPFFGNCDGMFCEDPFIIGIDMDLRRISGVISAARKFGKQALVFARLCQIKALVELFHKDGVRYFNIEDAVIKSVFSFSSLIAEPEREPYITKEGAYIDDEAIRVCCEARKERRKKDKAAQKED